MRAQQQQRMQGLMLGNKRGNSGYDFVLKTNTYGCWYYPDDHHNKNYAKSAFWGAASSEAEMKDPNPGANTIQGHTLRMPARAKYTPRFMVPAAR